VSCARAESSVQAYVDGELTGVDREQFQRHVSTCDACARTCRLQGRFKAAIRAHLPRPPIPTDFRRRLRASLEAEELAGQKRWPWLTHPRLVPAAAAALLLLGITLTVRQTQSPLLRQAQRSYRAEMPMDVVGSDCGSIASWFRGRVDFPVHAPALGGQATCKGGRLVNVGERPAAYIVYQDLGGHRVSFLVFDLHDESIEAPHRRIVNGREIYLGAGPGVSTAAYQDRGLGYVATSDLDEDALARLVTTAFRVGAGH
jgi:anti-sigma factor (TIGR02949 family)